MEVIPAINCHLGDTRCVEEKIRAAEQFADWVHLDVADGRFTFNKTWADPAVWAHFRTKLNLEVHLMVDDPENYISPWFAAGAKRFVVHVESFSNESPQVSASAAGTASAASEKLDAIFKACKGRADVVISSNPETPVQQLRPHINATSFFQVLAVHPGVAGQKFLPLMLDKMRFLRKTRPDAKIEVDGGVTLETGRLAKEAGADILVAASYVFGSEDPQGAYESLKKL